MEVNVGIDAARWESERIGREALNSTRAPLPMENREPASTGLDLKVWQFEQNDELRFAKVRRGAKRPAERGWLTRGYSYNVIQAYARQFTNYGVLCGHGGLAVPDADSPELEEAIEKNLPETLTVQTGSGGKHYYYFCGEVRKRILLERYGEHFGEVQSHGQMVVGPGSIHPNGQRYEIIKDAPIVEVSYDALTDALRPLAVQKKEPKPYVLQGLRSPRAFDINAVAITWVLDTSEYQRSANGELYGPNPWHGSESGANTWVNEEKNVAYCFRHHAGIPVAKAIALNEGIVRACDDVLSRDQFLRVLQIAQEKYGLQR